MGKDMVTVTLYRESSTEDWGFSLEGGRGTDRPLSIAQVSKNSLAAKVGLNDEDYVLTVAGTDVARMTAQEAEEMVERAGNKFQMVIQRDSDSTGRKISYENSAMTVSLKLGGAPQVEKVDEAFISNVPVTEDTPSLMEESGQSKKAAVIRGNTKADMSKTYNRRDWNCPWMHKDGRGMKQAIRALDEAICPAKTSYQHYYSEPRSILSSEPMLTPEQVQELIREHGAESRPASSDLLKNGDTTYGMEAEMEAEIEEEMRMRETRNNVEADQGVYVQDEHSNGAVNGVDEEQVQYYSEREVDSQAPPDLEPVTPVPQDMVGQDGCYEPSADELIEVLKNLENLAAANPGLYRSIVSQIKDNTGLNEQLFGEQGYDGQAYYQQQQQLQQQQYQFQSEEHQAEYEQQMTEQSLQYEQEMYQQSEQQVMHQEESFHRTETLQESSQLIMEEQQQHHEQQLQHEQQQLQQETGETEEETKLRLKMQRLEREAQEQVREALEKQREKKLAKLHPPQPPKPKEITVIAGDGKAVKITLGTEKNAEENRKQVAEAAGLKHIPLPDFDGDLSSSAWAGSLKRTERSMAQSGRPDVNDGGSPWAGSLRHVNQRQKKVLKREEEDMYGTAPWMGTLRHVVHDNKVMKNFGVNQYQSKRYPDEDATNPFEGSGGSQAHPAYPLTPAAIINGCAMTRNEMALKEDEEEIQRIRGNMQSETVSSALLKALMPKLLKVHESKYSAMDRDEASRILEEILAMQVGLNVDQQADANEEAEMIIRAIMQEEVGGQVYSRMADDLEAASQRRKKEAQKKKVKKAKKQPATVQPVA